MSSCQGCKVLSQAGNAAVLPYFDNMQTVNSTTESKVINPGDTVYFSTSRKDYLATGLNLIQLNKMMDANLIKNSVTEQFQKDGNTNLECVWVRISGIRDGNALFSYAVEYAVANTSPAIVGGSAELTFIQPRGAMLTIAIVIASLVFTWQFVLVLGIAIAIIIIAFAVKQWLTSGDGSGGGGGGGGLLGLLGIDVPSWAGSALTIGAVLVVVLGGILLLVGISGIGLNVNKKGITTTPSTRKAKVSSKGVEV